MCGPLDSLITISGTAFTPSHGQSEELIFSRFKIFSVKICDGVTLIDVVYRGVTPSHYRNDANRLEPKKFCCIYIFSKKSKMFKIYSKTANSILLDTYNVNRLESCFSSSDITANRY